MPPKRQKRTSPAEELDRDSAKPEITGGSRQICWKTELAYFDDYPLSQTCIKTSEFVKFDPVTAVVDTSTVFDFVLPPYTEYIYDPTNIRFGASISIVKSGGLPVQAYSKDSAGGDGYDPVCLVNSPLTSLISRIEVLVNDTPVNSSCGEHHYRAFLENTFNYSAAAKSTLLAPSGYHPDLLKPWSAVPAENLGLFKRAAFTENGHAWHVYGKLHHDVFNSSKTLPLGTKLSIRLHKNHSDVLLLVDGTDRRYLDKGYRVRVNRIFVEALRMKLAPETISYLESAISKQVARFFLCRMEIRKFFVPGNSLEWTATNLFTDQVPLRLFTALVKTTAYQGTLTTNPFCFQNFDISYLALKVDNTLVEPVLQPDWNSTDFVHSYVQTLKALRALDKPGSIDLPMDLFQNGPLTVFGWDTSPDKSDSSPCKNGVTSLEMRFRKPAPKEGLTGIVMGYFHGMMTIDAFKNVTVFDRIYKL